MLTRLTHAAIAFAVVVMVYQIYVLVAVPFLEPDWQAIVAAGESDSDQLAGAKIMVHKYRELLSAYFPADHWSLQQPPKTFENKRIVVVLDNYHPRDDGQVRVDRCAILFFPKPRERGAPPPRDAIVLEAPNGAVLQMDNGIRQAPASFGQFQFGQLQWGKLLGQITIRSDMRQPGPQDDLHIATRDIYITEHFIRTEAEVDMQLGPHRGQGRVLEIRLLPAAHTGGILNVGGIDTLEVTKNVLAIVQPGKAKIFGASNSSSQVLQKTTESTIESIPSEKAEEPDKHSRHRARREGDRSKTAPAAPVKVTCRGPFTIDFTSFIASFTDQVEAVQIHADGQRDDMQGDNLNIYFALKSEPAVISRAKSSPLPLTGIRPAMVELIGSPAVINVPSQESSAQCDRMRLQLDSQITTFDGQREVALQYRGSEIHAPMIHYQHPMNESRAQSRKSRTDRFEGQHLAPRSSPITPTRLGTLLALGSGKLRVVANQNKPSETFELHWKEEMRLDRSDGQPVLTVKGRPRLSMVGLGDLWADSLKLYLREQQVGSHVLPADVVPDRMSAIGRVAIDSADLTVRVHELAVWIDYARNDASSAIALGSADGNRRPSINQSLGNRGAMQQRAYGIAGNKLQMKLLVRDRRPEVTNIGVDGSVLFKELPTETAATTNSFQPLVIQAAKLRVDKADTPAAEIEIIGAPATARHSAVDADVSVRGMTIRAAALKLNRGTSHAMINSPGELELSVDRDLQGQPLAQPQPMKITWKKSMELDRDRITFSQEVKARSGRGLLRTERLGVKLTAPVRFDGAARQPQPELAVIDCSGGVTAQFDQQDAAGTTSEQRMKMSTLAVNQQTGKIQGSGPGWVESVHLAGSSGQWAVGSEQVAGASGQRLRYLQVEFQRGVQGNLHQRYVEVFGNVKAIYGPIDSWEQRLVRSRRDGPDKDTIWISSDKLRVGENPLARVQRARQQQSRLQTVPSMGPMVLNAEGHVVIEGRDPKRGEFTANGHRATYDQQKSMFVLEGDGHSPATLSQQQYTGSPLSENSFRKIIYWQSTGNWELEGVSKLELNQFDIGRGEAQGTRR